MRAISTLPSTIRSRSCSAFPISSMNRILTPAPKPLGRGLTEYVLRTGEPLLATPDRSLKAWCARRSGIDRRSLRRLARRSPEKRQRLHRRAGRPELPRKHPLRGSRPRDSEICFPATGRRHRAQALRRSAPPLRSPLPLADFERRLRHLPLHPQAEDFSTSIRL
jgi:hypothetical protein